MKLWRVIMSTHHHPGAGLTFSFTLPTFYVPAVSAAHAAALARNIANEPTTSGLVIEVDEGLVPVAETHLSWETPP